MSCSWFSLMIILALGVLPALSVTVSIKTSKLESLNVRKLWTSTGFSPPKPHQSFKDFLSSDAFIQNIRLIGSLPYAPGTFQIRIHWLLDLVSVSAEFDQEYDFTELDKLVTLLHDNNLRLGFELMGNPSNAFTDFESSAQVYRWSNLIEQIGRPVLYVLFYKDLRYAILINFWRFTSLQLFSSSMQCKIPRPIL